MNPPDNHSGWLRRELVASWREIALVIALSLGYFIISSTWVAYDRWSGHPATVRISDFRLLHLIAVQSAILALFLGFLARRGWQPSDFRINVDFPALRQGFSLLFIWILASAVMSFLLVHKTGIHHPIRSVQTAGLHHLHFGWLVLVVSQIVNAFSEELIVMGYAFNQLAAKRGRWVAFAVTLGIRISYHTWKIPVSLAVTTVHFLIFGIYYQERRNLGPLLIAHALYDVYVLAPWASGLC
jgi:membrane protease YdiL (CAAX protease family)